MRNEITISVDYNQCDRCGKIEACPWSDIIYWNKFTQAEICIANALWTVLLIVQRALTQCKAGLVFFFMTHRQKHREERVWWFNLALSRMEGISFWCLIWMYRHFRLLFGAEILILITSLISCDSWGEALPSQVPLHCWGGSSGALTSSLLF